MKKTLFILSAFSVFLAAYFYFSKPQPVAFKACNQLHLIKISDEALELRGSLVFHNPNKMRAELGKLKVRMMVNDSAIGELDEQFRTAIKGGSDFPFEFQVRFPGRVLFYGDSTLRTVKIHVSGSAGSDVLFSNYTFPVDFTANIDNPY